MEPHAPADGGTTPPPQLDSPFVSSTPERRGSRCSIPSLNLDAPSPDPSPQATPWNPETASDAADAADAAYSTPPSPGRGRQLSRVSTLPLHAGSQQLQAKHSRSGSSPMGYTGDKGPAAPQRGAAALFGSLFAAKPADQNHPPAASLQPAQLPRTRSGSTMSTKSTSKGFFAALGSAVHTQLSTTHSTSTSPPASPSRRAGPDSTLLIDEFAGISFRQLLSSYTLPPTDPSPDSPTDPSALLSDLSTTAADLLDRVYSAYKSRTASLAALLESHADTAELLEESRARTAQYKLQLSRLAADEADVREEQNFRIGVHERRIKQLESQLAVERQRREEAERAGKRISAASDSGCESDGESMFSRGSSPTESFMEDGGRCEACVARGGGGGGSSGGAPSIRKATKLSQEWSPGGSEGEKTPTQVASPVAPPTTTAAKWGFGSLTRKAWAGGGVEEVRSENRVLRARVGELERVVDDCLEFVAGRERGVVG